ncbi:LysR substrate-binding domain-containing protein, partial [Burkholderia gladioli]|uniref:LysR substrate-binding domain-containing protein n=1 Tax=Burkholderia gladioli TaxID=28095 RepID=UPI001FC83133
SVHVSAYSLGGHDTPKSFTEPQDGLPSRLPTAGPSLPLSMVCNSLDMLLYMALAGRGIACVPDFSVRTALADGRLKTVLDPYVTGSSSIHVVWPSTRKMTPKVRVFVDFVHTHFGKCLVTKADEPKRQKVRRPT